MLLKDGKDQRHLEAGPGSVPQNYSRCAFDADADKIRTMVSGREILEASDLRREDEQ